MEEIIESKRTSWPVMEPFYTIQGEGHYSGRAAYFIRTAGSDVGCVWCDVKESWEAGDHPETYLETFLKGVNVTCSDFVVITGREPAMYPIETLVSALQEQGIELAIDTSGSYPLVATVDWYCFSPKTFKA